MCNVHIVSDIRTGKHDEYNYALYCKPKTICSHSWRMGATRDELVVPPFQAVAKLTQKAYLLLSIVCTLDIYYTHLSMCETPLLLL